MWFFSGTGKRTRPEWARRFAWGARQTLLPFASSAAQPANHWPCLVCSLEKVARGPERHGAMVIGGVCNPQRPPPPSYPVPRHAHPILSRRPWSWLALGTLAGTDPGSRLRCWRDFQASVRVLRRWRRVLYRGTFAWYGERGTVWGTGTSPFFSGLGETCVARFFCGLVGNERRCPCSSAHLWRK